MKWIAFLGGSAFLMSMWVFFKIGFIFFGGGFLLIPVIHNQLVLQLHWITEREFIDGVAISQLTPGPIAVLATFCGYHHAGAVCGYLSTLAIFAPGFLLMLFISYGYKRLGNLKGVKVVLAKFTPAIIGLLLAAAIQIGKTIPVTPVTTIVFVVSLILMVNWRLNPVYLIAGSAILGMALKM